MKRRTFSKSLSRALPFSIAGQRFSSLVFMAVALAGLGFSTISPQSAADVRSYLSDQALPVIKVFSAPFQDGVVFIRNVSGLANMQAENERLTQENAVLRNWYHTAEALRLENQALQALLNVKVQPQSKYVTARVLSDSGNRFVHSLLVTAGTSDGVRKSQAVLSEQGAIGRVVEAGENASRILLMTDINSRIPVIIEDGGHHAILAGQNDQDPVLDHLPPDLKIAEGSRVVTSGKGGVFAPGMPIGLVVQKGDSYEVEMFADFNRLLYVRIVEEPQNQEFIQID